MKIYLLLNDREAGPFTWLEVFVMLRKGEIDDQTLGIVDDASEFRSLEELGFWREGQEAGPFTWDEIIFLLQEDCLDYQVQARIEGDSELSSLKEVIAKSDEVSLSEPSETSSESEIEAVQVEGMPASSWKKTFALAALVLVCGSVLAYVVALRWPSSHVITNTAVPTVRQPSVQASSVPAVVPTNIAAHVDSSTPSKGNSVESKLPVENATPSAPAQTIPGKSALQAQVNSGSPASDVIAKTSNLPAAAPVSSPQSKVVSTIDPGGRSAPRVSATTPTPVPTPLAALTVSNFFHIESVKLLKKEPKDGVGLWSFQMKDNKAVIPGTFVSCLEVSVLTAENIRADKTSVRAYFYDKSNTLVATQRSPGLFGTSGAVGRFALPVLFHKDKAERMFFPVPKELADKAWKAVVVFGDKDEAKSACYPPNESDFLLNYPEKALVYDRMAKRVNRRPAIDPLVEQVVKTKNPKMPQITLFLRPPAGVNDSQEIQGVLAICLLAGSLDEVRRELQKEEMGGDYNGILGFANKHKLAIIAWGARSLWDRTKNTDEMARAQARELDESFDTVADAWERGVKELAEKYSLPTKDYLLWGSCGSAQWAHRLCLRKPEYFLAIDFHIPGSFDKPTPEANKVLWCLTTGELYSGYRRSKKFVAQCQALGYPMVFKAIVGLGHAGHPDAAEMGFRFFEFALTLKAQRDELDKKLASNIDRVRMGPSVATTPWPEAFQHPPFYGDMVNQNIYPADQVDQIPAAFRVPIPTAAIKEVWGRSK